MVVDWYTRKIEEEYKMVKQFEEDNVFYLNSFLIWKYTVRWSLYPEITLFNGEMIYGNLRSKKKKRRIEILYELLRKLILEKKFEENKIYKMVNKENMKRLINFASRKKKRKIEIILLSEKKEEFIKERICKNWTAIRKKPPKN
jgi:hypothetical protein